MYVSALFPHVALLSGTRSLTTSSCPSSQIILASTAQRAHRAQLRFCSCVGLAMCLQTQSGAPVGLPSSVSFLPAFQRLKKIFISHLSSFPVVYSEKANLPLWNKMEISHKVLSIKKKNHKKILQITTPINIHLYYRFHA